MSKINNFEYMIEDYILFCTSKNLAKKTIISYERSLKLFSTYLIDELDVKSFEEVETRDIRRYINHLYLV